MNAPERRSLFEKITALSAEARAEVEDFVDFIAGRDDGRGLTEAALLASAPSLASVWDDPENDGYDAL